MQNLESSKTTPQIMQHRRFAYKNAFHLSYLMRRYQICTGREIRIMINMIIVNTDDINSRIKCEEKEGRVQLSMITHDDTRRNPRLIASQNECCELNEECQHLIH